VESEVQDEVPQRRFKRDKDARTATIFKREDKQVAPATDCKLYSTPMNSMTPRFGGPFSPTVVSGCGSFEESREHVQRAIFWTVPQTDSPNFLPDLYSESVFTTLCQIRTKHF